jgi:hypothetical protein
LEIKMIFENFLTFKRGLIAGVAIGAAGAGFIASCVSGSAPASTPGGARIVAGYSIEGFKGTVQGVTEVVPVGDPNGVIITVTNPAGAASTSFQTAASPQGGTPTLLPGFKSNGNEITKLIPASDSHELCTYVLSRNGKGAITCSLKS